MQTTSYQWNLIAQMLQSTSSGDALVRVHPKRTEITGKLNELSDAPVCMSLLDSLGNPNVSAGKDQEESGKKLRDGLKGLLNQLSVFEQISRCPILGIAGLLNSGKSTLLSTYLSPTGRQRVLCGLSNRSGTHRFVLWLPTLWRDQPELMSTLETFLSQLFGHTPEALSDDPPLAAQQYNGQILIPRSTTTDPLSIPLVAFDTGLDALKLGLLDCPDIQTGFWTVDSLVPADAMELALKRQARLASVGRLCSAFIIMSTMNSLHDQGLIDILTTLRDTMPGVPRILAVNRIKARYAPEVVAEEARSLTERFAIRTVFVAYDYRSSLAHTRIPPMPERLERNLDGSPLPVFFEARTANSEVSSSADSNTGNQVKCVDNRLPGNTVNYLFHLGQQLDPGSLSIESCRSLVLQLKSLVLEAVGWHSRNLALRHQQLVDAWQAISLACYDFMAERDSSGRCIGLRLQTSPAIIAQMSESLRRTAPFWLRPSLAIDRSARQLQQAMAAKVERFKLVQNATQAVSDFAKRFRRGEGAQVVTPDRLARSIRDLDVHDSLQSLNDSELLASCQIGLARFASEEQPSLDEKALDQWTAIVWKNMNWRDQIRRGVQPLALLTGPLLAALLIPFDSGGTAVLVFATTNELLAAAGIAVLLPTVAGGGEMMRIIHQETPWQQLSDLFAALCDSLGLQRPSAAELPSCGSDNRKLLLSRLPVKLSGSSIKLPDSNSTGLGAEAIRPSATASAASGEADSLDYHGDFSVWKAADGTIARLQAAAERLN